MWRVDWDPPAPAERSTPAAPARLTAGDQSPFSGRIRKSPSWRISGSTRRPANDRSSSSPESPASARPAWLRRWQEANATGATVLSDTVTKTSASRSSRSSRPPRPPARPAPHLLAAHVDATAASSAASSGTCIAGARRADPPTGGIRHRAVPAVRGDDGLLTLATHSNPMVLLLDDLHWATKPTLLLLRRLAEVPNPLPLLIIGTYRASDLSADHPLVDTLADLHREAGVTHVALDGLSNDGVMDLMVALAGHEARRGGSGLRAPGAAGDAGQPVLRRRAAAAPCLDRHARAQRDGVWSTDVDLETIVLPDSVRGRRSAGPPPSRTGQSRAQRRRRHRGGVRPDDVEHRARPERRRAPRRARRGGPGGAGRRTGRPPRPVSASSTRSSATRCTTTSAPPAVPDAPSDRRGPRGALRRRSRRRRLSELAHHWLAATAPADRDKAITYTMRAGRGRAAPTCLRGGHSAAPDRRGSAGRACRRRRRGALAGVGRRATTAADPRVRATLVEAADEARRRGDAPMLAMAAWAAHRWTAS